MGFETIGPYALTRRDLIAAALVISFVTGSRATRCKAWLMVAVGLLLIIQGISAGDILNILLGVGLLLLLFALAPAMRSLKQVNPIYLSYSPDGLIAETPILRTTYKWSTVGTAKKVGRRLFIMISPMHALVVSDHVTSPENMRRLVASLEDGAQAGGVE